MTEQQTSHPLAESLSALVDNQASELELQRILKASQSDVEVKATWARYQLASAGMRHDLPVLEITDFAARVSAAIDDEPEVLALPETPVPAKKPYWWQNVARFAVAASVAGGVILFAQNPGGVTQTPEFIAAAPAASESAPVADIPAGYHSQALSLRTVGMQQGYEARKQDHRQLILVPRQAVNANAAAVSKIQEAEVREYLTQLIESHADNAALNSSQGMLPFARATFIVEE